MRRFERRRGDPAPSSPVAVVLASDGRGPFSAESVRAVARAATAGETVAVVTIARVHGFALGMPHPGLLPTRQELDERQRWIAEALRQLLDTGLNGDGQLTITRSHAKVIAAVARRRDARAVIVDQAPLSTARRLVEGDLGATVRRRLAGAGVAVMTVCSSGTAGRR